MKKTHKLFFANRWKIAYRINHSDDIFDFKSTIPFKYVSFPKGYWGADPFLYKCGDKILIFCEYTNEKKSKSFISYKELFPSEEKDWHVAYEFEGHTSYPCIFEYDNNLFMIPETTFENSVRVLKYDREHNKWVKYSCLFSDINAPDTTFFVYNSKPYIFLYEIISHTNRNLHLCELDEKLLNVVKDYKIKNYSVPDGRPGGNCIKRKDKIYRVVQPGVSTYGEKINVFEFSFNDGCYSEELVVEIIPNDLNIEEKNRFLGIHTYNKLDDLEVVDILVKGRFDLFRPIKILFKRMRIFGFGQYESDKLFVNKNFCEK